MIAATRIAVRILKEVVQIGVSEMRTLTNQAHVTPVALPVRLDVVRAGPKDMVLPLNEARVPKVPLIAVEALLTEGASDTRAIETIPTARTTAPTFAVDPVMIARTANVGCHRNRAIHQTADLNVVGRTSKDLHHTRWARMRPMRRIRGSDPCNASNV